MDFGHWNSKMEEIWIEHYSSGHKILLVGEGDFSFAKSLASAFGDASNMTATSLDSEEELLSKHPTAASNLEFLKSKGCRILHDIDANAMKKHRRLKSMKFDRIVFNFPHAGFSYRRYFRESDPIQITHHKNLVRGFLENAYKMVSYGGEVHVTHKKGYPYSMWDIEDIAKEEGFKLEEEVEFYLEDYPGYTNKRGDGLKSNKTFHVGACSTFKFVRKYQSY